RQSWSEPDADAGGEEKRIHVRIDVLALGAGVECPWKIPRGEDQSQPGREVPRRAGTDGERRCIPDGHAYGIVARHVAGDQRVAASLADADVQGRAENRELAG